VSVVGATVAAAVWVGVAPAPAPAPAPALALALELALALALALGVGVGVVGCAVVEEVVSAHNSAGNKLGSCTSPPWLRAKLTR